MAQYTINKLFKELEKEIKKGNGAKYIVMADDEEGNAYHGMFYGLVSSPRKVKEAIDFSDGLYDSVEEDYNKIVILG